MATGNLELVKKLEQNLGRSLSDHARLIPRNDYLNCVIESGSLEMLQYFLQGQKLILAGSINSSFSIEMAKAIIACCDEGAARILIRSAPIYCSIELIEFLLSCLTSYSTIATIFIEWKLE